MSSVLGHITTDTPPVYAGHSVSFVQYSCVRNCDYPCHNDVIIRLGNDDVMVDLGNVVARCLNDVILNGS